MEESYVLAAFNVLVEIMLGYVIRCRFERALRASAVFIV